MDYLLLLDAAPEAGGEGAGGYSGLIMIVAMVVIFYFFMIRPQSKKQKEIKKAREAMQKGDNVVTAGGIHGKIKEINDITILIEVSQVVFLKVDKASLFQAGQQEPIAKEGNK